MNQSRNGVRVHVIKFANGSTVTASCNCFGHPFRAHSNRPAQRSIMAKIKYQQKFDRWLRERAPEWVRTAAETPVNYNAMLRAYKAGMRSLPSTIDIEGASNG